MTTLHFEILTEDWTIQAYPLIRELHPALSLDEWRKRASTLVRGDGEQGIVGALRNGYLRGLFTFHVATHACGERELVIDNLIMMDMLPGSSMAARVASEIRAMSRRLAVHRIRLDSPRGALTDNPDSRPFGDIVIQALKANGLDVSCRVAP